MSSSPRDRFDPDLQSSDLTVTGEDTLRLIASLPAPEGLADRVQSGLHHAPPTGRVLNWRGPLRPSGNWMQSTMARGAAAGSRGQGGGDASARGARWQWIFPGRGKARSADAGRSGAEPSCGRQHRTESCRQGAWLHPAGT
jgi:hypothetical protein